MWTVYYKGWPTLVSEEVRAELSLCEGQNISLDTLIEICRLSVEKAGPPRNAQHAIRDDDAPFLGPSNFIYPPFTLDG